MKKSFCIIFILTLTAGISFYSCRQITPPPEKTIANELLDQVQNFVIRCNQLQSVIEKSTADQDQLQYLFLQFRISYKRMEWAAEYFSPASARLVNGPPVQEIEMPEIQVIDPAGLQVIEGYLFPKYDSANKKELIKQLSMLKVNVSRYNTYFANIDIFNWQVFDATKLELFRIITLGISGFDNPLTLRSSKESAASLESLKKVLSDYKDSANTGDLAAKMDAAIHYLNMHTDFNSFNRMEFITRYANPISVGISDLEEKLKIHVIRYNRLLNQDAKTLFDTNAFNVNAYAPDLSGFISEEKIVLGKKLFEDPVLSGTGKRSCRSCHQPELAFTDGMAKNTIIGGKELLDRNTPTLINAALQPGLFYDLRVNSLEEQSHTVVQSTREMHGSMELSVQKLGQDSAYRRMFINAFPHEDKNRIDTFEVMNAIGSYIRSLVLLNSRFDEYMRGRKSAMDSTEINGFNLFMGKARCATCHYMPLFNGSFPPMYRKNEVEVIGVPKSRSQNVIDPDLGRYDIVKVESVKHAFKISTVRNAARTAPYMHNGVYATLKQVMDFYNKGGGAGLGIKLTNQTLPADKLNLSEKEISEVIAFIKSLDSKLPVN
jgi:cytochrome c peroxidase